MAVFKSKIRSYGWALVLAGAVTALFFIAHSTPYHETFIQIHNLKRAMRLGMGAGYWVGDQLLSLTPFALILIFILSFVFFSGVGWLYRQRRWPSLTLVIIAVVVNWIIFGATTFVTSPYIAGELPECEYLFDGQTTIKLRRFPIDESIVYGEQTFVLVTNDAGETWRQIFQSYGVNPYFLHCESIQRNGQDGLTIYVERMIDIDNNEILVLTSDDRGITWTIPQ